MDTMVIPNSDSSLSVLRKQRATYTHLTAVSHAASAIYEEKSNFKRALTSKAVPSISHKAKKFSVLDDDRLLE